MSGRMEKHGSYNSSSNTKRGFETMQLISAGHKEWKFNFP
jgi:hypothetical protein